MSIVLQGSTSGSITLQEPAVAGSTVLSLPATTGTVVVSGTTPSFNGIAFPATQSASSDANTLDDYEEGTWTPAVIGSISAGTASYNFRAGKYTKIGNLVTISCNVNYTSATGTGALLLSGLPFTSVSTSGINPNGGVMMHSIDLPAGAANITTYVSNNNTVAYFYVTTDNGAWADVQVDSAGEFYVTITYFTS